MDISPRTSAYVVKELLKRGMPYLVFEKFGQAKPLPKNSTKSISFRRYFLDMGGADFTPYGYYNYTHMDPANAELTEGVTPTAINLAKQDITATLTQYGSLVTISDVIMDTHEDPVLKEAVEVLGEQAAVILEKARFNILKACSNVFYANGSARSDVNTVFTVGLQRKVVRALKRNLAKPITSIVRSTPAYGTEPIAPAFIAVCHPDLEYDIRNATGFTPAEKYGTVSPWEGEIGKIGDVRYILSTICEPYPDAGATGGTNVISTSGSNADVYPIIYIARDAYGIVPLKGKNAIVPMVVNPTPSDSDPLAQRGHVSWKAMQTTVILNDAWMAVAEVACTDDLS